MRAAACPQRKTPFRFTFRDGLQVRLRQVLRRAPDVQAGVVNRDVQAPEAIQRLLERRVHPGLHPDIGLERQAAAPGRAHLRLHLGLAGQGTIQEGEIGARLREAAGERPADVPQPPRDERDLPPQRKKIHASPPLARAPPGAQCG